MFTCILCICYILLFNVKWLVCSVLLPLLMHLGHNKLICSSSEFIFLNWYARPTFFPGEGFSIFFILILNFEFQYFRCRREFWQTTNYLVWPYIILDINFFLICHYFVTFKICKLYYISKTELILKMLELKQKVWIFVIYDKMMYI